MAVRWEHPGCPAPGDRAGGLLQDLSSTGAEGTAHRMKKGLQVRRSSGEARVWEEQTLAAVSCHCWGIASCFFSAFHLFLVSLSLRLPL